MSNIRNPIAAFQKIYDDAHLICSTAIYFESLANEGEALRCWRNALEQLIYQQYSNRLPAGYVPKSETERALLDSLRKLETQCRERVELLETLERSRRETGPEIGQNGAVLDNGMGVGTLGSGTIGNGSLGSGTILPMDHSDLAKPPKLPTRPPPTSRNISTESGGDLIALSPNRSRDDPSPDKKTRMRSSLRPEGRAKAKSPSAGSSASSLQPPAAAKAATQAWATKKSRSSGRKSRAEVVEVQDGIGKLEIGDKSGGKLRQHKQRPVVVLENQDPFDDDAELQLAPSKSEGYSSADLLPSSRSKIRGSKDNVSPAQASNILGRNPAIRQTVDPRQSKHRHGQLQSPTASNSQNLPAFSDASPNKATNVKLSSIHAEALKRKPVHEGVKEDSMVVEPSSERDGSEAGSEGEYSLDEEDEEEEELLEEEEPLSREEAWRIFTSSVLHNLPRGVERAAAEQILNEVIVQGDEVHWDDIAGLENAKAALKENVVYPFLRPDLFLGLREPARGMLLFGPPGTGKTMLARAVATEAKSTFFAISASSLIAKFLGESEKLVRALFAMAKMLAPSIIFVDEIDSLLSSRSGEGEHEATRRIKTEFLIQWSDLARAAAGREVTGREKERGDASRVLVLAATNVPWAIDDAARRRFVRRQYIPLPEKHVREVQFRTLLKHQINDLSEEDITKLVELTEGFSGSDITALTKDAAMGPLRSLGDRLLLTKTEDIRPIGMQDFVASMLTIRPSVSKQGLQQFEDWAKEFGERGG